MRDTPPPPSPTDAADAIKETGRVEAFSDGVFAIAITLLVLDLKVPRHDALGPLELSRALLKQWPTFLAYLTSFLTILVMWVNHHLMFARIRKIDQPFLFLNGFLLFLVTFIPFPTSLVAEYITQRDSRIAGLVFAGSWIVAAIAYNTVWRYASRWGGLLDPRVPAAEVRSITGQYLVGIPAYVVAFVLAFFSVPASVGLCLLLALYFAFTGTLTRVVGRERRRSVRAS